MNTLQFWIQVETQNCDIVKYHYSVSLYNKGVRKMENYKAEA